jgi:hypothetical protein
MTIMKAELIVRTRQNLTDRAFIEMVAWKVPVRVPGSPHDIKYRLALMSDSICVLRYDNERGKGDHKHVDEGEVPYRFIDFETLVADFMNDVRRWLDENAGR